MKRLVWFIIFLLAVAIAGWLVFLNRGSAVNTASLLRQARAAQRRSNFQETGRLTARVLDVDPANADALMLAAEAATRLEQLDAAIAHYSAVPPTAEQYPTAMWALGELLLYQRRAQPAEKALRAAIAGEPDHPRANSRLAILLGAEGRRWESLPFLLAVVRSGDFRGTQGGSPVPLELMYTAVLDNPVDTDEARRFLEADPDFLVPLINIARERLLQEERSEAESMLRRVLQPFPGQVEAQALLGELLVGRADDFHKWREALPEAALQHPGVWFAMGLQCREVGQIGGAVRCFIESLRLDPDHARANHHLAQTLIELGRPELAAPFAARETLLSDLRMAIEHVFSGRRDPETLRSIATLTEQLGRLLESAEWYRLVALADRSDATAPRKAVSLRNAAHRSMLTGVRTLATHQPLLARDWSEFALPDWGSPGASERSTPTEHAASHVRFDEVAAEVGVEFQYFNSADETTPGRRMYEYTGGGAAVLDFDRDSWPDLYLTQGAQWPVGSSAAQHNRLYRNLGGDQFLELSESSGTDDRGFGQGVAVGDVNNDGFPDLYVANIGRNTLFLNNGDGTFDDVSQQIADPSGTWTTSCAVADLDGDGSPDLYDVNYLEGDGLFSRMCSWGTHLRTCTPTEYSGEQDQAYRSASDGTWQRVTDEWGLTADDGKGLGVLVADLDDTGTLDVFVANDMAPNSCFLNQAARGQVPRFLDLGLASGLGTDRDGAVQACMGVAAGDADNDGAMDLFVTNYYQESNTLYLRRSDGLFSDRTVAARLRQPGFLQLGFGTQFLDADLDGWDDLLVTNGHIDDFAFEGTPEKMPPQFYHNHAGTFRVETDGVGPFFTGTYLGRGLARWDFNRDGLPDAVISHLESPAAILRNATPAAGHHVAVRLVGVASGRDAIGTTLRLRMQDAATRVRQLTAGDGYQASNEHKVIIGLGDSVSRATLEVHWVSGHVDIHEDIPRDCDLVVVEGRAKPIVVPR